MSKEFLRQHYALRSPSKGYETPKHLQDKGPRGQSEETFKRELEASEKRDKEHQQSHWKEK